jgi:hypothetical protein
LQNRQPARIRVVKASKQWRKGEERTWALSLSAKVSMAIEVKKKERRLKRGLYNRF